MTPCALVDLEVLERNAVLMSEKAARLGVRLRPHVKTHKCIEAAMIQVRGHFGGITVSTLAEARSFFEGGFCDITYAVAIAPSKLAEAGELLEKGCDLSLLLDSGETLSALEERARSRGLVFPVLLKVDCGYHRAGVDPESDAGLSLARRLAASRGADYRGLLTHAGHAYRCRSREEALSVARQERDSVVRFASRLREEGLRVEAVSVGSTPTMTAIDDLAGVTEIRPGNYLFFDAFQAAIGSCVIEECAFSVLATVIGRSPGRNELLIDAGALALSKDAGAAHVDPHCGFGVVASEAGDRLFPGLRIFALSQEHGQVRGPREDIDRFPLGARLRVIPNHSCLSAACFDCYRVLEGGEVVAEWRPARGW